MIPTVGEVLAAHAFLRRRYRHGTPPNALGIANALDMARRLALTADDEPAALFYALARFPKALGGLWARLPHVLAHASVHRSGRTFNATLDEVAALLVPIASNALTYDEVREWFAARMRPARGEGEE